MAPLKNQKHEAFCQLTVRGSKYGWSQAEIYQRSGFKASGHSAEVAASRLMKKVEVRARLSELAAPGVKKAQVTVESLLAELESNIVGATVSKQHGAVNGAVMLMGKLRGLLIDRVEHGAAGEFDQCQTADDVMEIVERDLGPETAAVLAAALNREEVPESVRIDYHARALLETATVEQAQEAILRLASDRAQVIEQRPAPRHVDETARAVEMFRPKRKGGR